MRKGFPTAVPVPRIQSPVNREQSSSSSNAMWSGVCPGVCIARKVAPSVLKTSPSESGSYLACLL